MAVLLFSTQALAQEDDIPLYLIGQTVTDSIMKGCITPLMDNASLSDNAIGLGLIELEPEKVQALSSAATRGFIYSADKISIAIVTSDTGACEVFIEKINPESLWYLAGYWFGPETPFHPSGENAFEGGIEKTFEGDLKGPMHVAIQTLNTPKEGTAQAHMTVTRPAAQPAP